ncbi:MAG: hypothetical protein ACLPVY_25885 [Acidimicrobiia bacterium]
MGDESEFSTDEPLIDVRSPAERWSDAGRANFERFRALVEDGRLDLVALWWMIFVVAYSLVEIYSALRASGFGNSPGSTDWWTKADLLASSGGISLVLTSMMGILLAAFFDGPAARLAFRLAIVGGAWAVAMSLLDIVVAFHENTGPIPEFLPSGAEAKVVTSLGALCVGGLGLVIALAGWRLAPSGRPRGRSGRRRDATGPDIAELS